MGKFAHINLPMGKTIIYFWKDINLETVKIQLNWCCIYYFLQPVSYSPARSGGINQFNISFCRAK